MSAPTRDPAVVQGEIATLCRLNDQAEQQLRELQIHEYNVVCAIEARRRKIDRLLDEMLERRRPAEGK